MSVVSITVFSFSFFHFFFSLFLVPRHFVHLLIRSFEIIYLFCDVCKFKCVTIDVENRNKIAYCKASSHRLNEISNPFSFHSIVCSLPTLLGFEGELNLC